MAHACNLSTLGGRGGWITRSSEWDHPGQHGETPSLLKIQKISWAWWCMPVILATQDAEAGELPEPRRRRLRWAEITPLHSSLGNESETPSQKKKESIPIFLNSSKELKKGNTLKLIWGWNYLDSTTKATRKEKTFAASIGSPKRKQNKSTGTLSQQ